MTLNETRRLSKHICRLLKVQDITWAIGRTSKGNLGIVFNTNNDDFDIMLDSIPLSTKNALEDENNIELKKMIEKYWFEQDTPTMSFTSPAHVPEVSAQKPEKKVGRPKKNGNTKTEETS